MKPGSVLVDLAVEQGGNVEGSRRRRWSTTANGVKILGIPTCPAASPPTPRRSTPATSSPSSALLDKDEGAPPDYEDEILKAALVTKGGAVVHPAFQLKAVPTDPAPPSPAPAAT